MSKDDRRGARYRVTAFLERVVVTSANRVILNTPQMTADFVAFYPDYASKFVTITNGYDPSMLPPPPSGVHAESPPWIFTHAGSLYRKRTPESLLEAVARLRDRGRIGRGTFVLRLVGSVDATFGLSALIVKHDLEGMVDVVGRVSHQESLAYLAASHALVLLQPGTAMQVPGKLFEYLAFARPILTIAPPGAAADIVSGHGLGLVADPDDAEAIASSLGQMIDGFDNDKHFRVDTASARARYDGRMLTETLATLMNEVAHP
jgi:glycosyltransferase involved in cell wall biosynthesis